MHRAVRSSFAADNSQLHQLRFVQGVDNHFEDFRFREHTRCGVVIQKLQLRAVEGVHSHVAVVRARPLPQQTAVLGARGLPNVLSLGAAQRLFHY